MAHIVFPAVVCICYLNSVYYIAYLSVASDTKDYLTRPFRLLQNRLELYLKPPLYTWFESDVEKKKTHFMQFLAIEIVKESIGIQSGYAKNQTGLAVGK